MTITPTDPGPATGPVTAAPKPGRHDDPSSGSQFLAAILQALAPTDTASATTGAAQEAGQADGSVAHDTDPTDDPTAAGLVLPPGLAGQLAAIAATGASAGGVPVPTTAPGHANVADGTDGAVGSPSSDIRMSGDAATSAVSAVPPGGRGVASTQPAAGGAHDAPASLPAGDAAADGNAGPQDADAGPPPIAAAPLATSTTTAPTSLAATVVPVGLTPVSAPATSGPAQPVTGQVFPEVTSLVSRGEGAHRITLTLKPEALGEVRVVMTVRDGAVHVRLAAGHEAQQALLEGSPELARLLEHAGATDSRIVVRDLTAPAPTSASADAGRDLGRDPGQGLGSGPGAGGHPSQDQHARTRAEHLATDGAHRSTTGANPLRPDEPATRTRHAGVDVAM